MDNFGEKWFTRRNGEIKGPFTLALLKSNLQSGRLLETDEVSQDQQTWIRVNVLLDATSPQVQQVSAGTNTPAHPVDERDGFDRRQGLPAPTPAILSRRNIRRRTREPAERIQRRQNRTRRMAHLLWRQPKRLVPLVVVSTLVLLLFILAAYFAQPFPTPKADCQAPAHAAVNWENCVLVNAQLNHADLQDANLRNMQLIHSQLINANLQNADLSYADLRHNDFSYADLRGANLKGSQLQQAVLANSRLTGADLSFADLRGAQLQDSQLDGVRLDRAIWVDGRVCAAPSTGRCE